MVIEDVPGIQTFPMDTIHRSKITVPPVAGISRPHLVERIELGVQGKLTVLSAPAGWGKSTLLAEWAAQTATKVAWVSLDEGDSNPTRFFRAVVAALDHIYPLRMDDVFTMLRSPTPAIDEQIDLAILSRLEEFPEHTVIVLDDFQVLTWPELLRSFSRVLEQLPPRIHLVIATRGDLQFPLARMRSAGSVTLLRSEDLAFTVPEAIALLHVPSMPFLEPGDIALLVERTEGWVAGLRLAGISLGRQGDTRSAIARFRGTHRDVADYFREEVLDRLDDDLRQFLIETSVLSRFTDALCNTVTGRTNAHDLLAQVAAADLFLIPLDDERTWYRYHGLFRDLLQADFARLPGERQAELNHRASIWYERNHMVVEAVNHAFAASDPDRAADLVDQYADTLMFACGETNMLVGWIEQLPSPLLQERSGLVRVYAWALTTAGRVDQAARLLDPIRTSLLAQAPGNDSPGTREREAHLAAVQARIAAYRNDDRATIVHGRRALDLLDPMRHGKTCGDVVLSIGFAERSLGNTETAADAFAEAARLGRLHGNIQAARWGVRYLAVTRVSQGRLREAEAMLDEDLERVRQESADPGSMLSALLVGKGEILLQRNRLAEARQALEKAIVLIQRVGDAKMLMNAYVAIAMVLQAEGRVDNAREKIRRAEEIFPSNHRGAHSAWLALLQGNVSEAERWADLSGYCVDDVADPARGDFEQMVYARIMVRTNPGPESSALLQRMVEDAEAGGRFGRVIELLNIQAMTEQRAGNAQRAIHALYRSLSYARHEGFARVYLDEGPEMRGLLRELVRNRDLLDDTTRVYAMELLSLFTTDPADPGASPSMAEPLTGRQLEILHLLAAGPSNRDIANQLFIAEGTVKAHMHQVFGKLMARNRTEAVANARDLHLLT